MASEPLFYTLTFFAFALGAVVGSFLNVVIHRVPRGESIISPGSRCPSCENPIRWYDNIPIVSWFVLNGQCRDCGVEISARYALVEALTGFLAAALWVKVATDHFDGTTRLTELPWLALALAFVFYFAFLALLVAITFVDLDHYLIPHEFTLPGMALGVIATWVLGSFPAGTLGGLWPPVELSHSVIGLVGGALAVVLVFYLYLALRGIAGLGGGDVTMMALMGAWLGWPALIFIFFAASVQGLIAAVIGMVVGAGFLKDSEEILSEDDPRDGEDTPETSDADSGQPPAGDTEETNEEPDDPEQQEDSGGLAVPFGPFIALAGVQYFFLGEFLPASLSLEHLFFY